MRALSFACLLMASALAVSAQQQVISPETPVNSAMLHQWLQSGDPRLIAWAADFAQRTHDPAALAEMAKLIERWTTPQFSGTNEAQSAQRRAAIAVLDALIRENTEVSILAIIAIAETFPAQALILVSRMPLSQSRETLDGWTWRATEGPAGLLLARVASMMLATEPEPSLVARVVAASEEHLQVSIISGDGGGIGGSSACGDSLGTSLSPGWPQVYRYELLENDPNTHASPVVELDGDRIDVLRIEENAGWGSCGDQVERLDPATRHRLIAHWLGVRDSEMSWQPVEQLSIVWKNKADYEAQLGAAVEAHRQKLRETVEMLHKRGLLTDDSAQSLTPRLVVSISCDIKPCPLT